MSDNYLIKLLKTFKKSQIKLKVFLKNIYNFKQILEQNNKYKK